MRPINKIIVHCSDSPFGNPALIDFWHKQRGFAGIGYHFVIGNGVEQFGIKYNPNIDGVIWPGRPVEDVGAHCKGHNSDSIGVCLVGKHTFTAKQLYDALPSLLAQLSIRFNLTSDKIYGHRDFDPGKTCPNFDVKMVRQLLDLYSAFVFLAKSETTQKGHA